MKNTILFILLFIFCNSCIAQTKINNINIINDKNEYKIKMNENIIDIGHFQIIPIDIVNPKNIISKDSFKVLDLGCSNPFLLYAIDDSDFGNRALLHIYEIIGGKLKSVRFYYTENKKEYFFETLTAINNYILIDKYNSIYYCSSIEESQIEKKRYFNVEKYSWNIKEKKFAYVKNKKYSQLNSKYILNDKW